MGRPKKKIELPASFRDAQLEKEWDREPDDELPEVSPPANADTSVPYKLGSRFVTASEMMTFIQAAHVSQHVAWDLDSRGGIGIVAYPEHLKTRLVDLALRPYPEALAVSDINLKELGEMKGDLLDGRYETVAFLDYQKVWERDPRTSSNVEGAIRALTDEGWQGFASAARQGRKARAFVLMCLTDSFYEERIQGWASSGFSRRILFLRYIFKDRHVLEDSILSGSSYPLSFEHTIPVPKPSLIYDVPRSEAEYIRTFLKSQRGLIPLQLVLRIYNTLRWFYRTKGCVEYAMDILERMADLMTVDGGDLKLVAAPRPLFSRGENTESKGAINGQL